MTLRLTKARRFITFIDACYESRTKLFLSSEAPITEIFSDESSEERSSGERGSKSARACPVLPLG